MGTNRTTAILLAFALQLLMVGATAAPLADTSNPIGTYENMNDDLREELYQSEYSEILPVIFQLNSPVTQSDLTTLEQFGATVLGDAPLVHGGMLEA